MAKKEPEKCPKCGDPGPFMRVAKLKPTEKGDIFQVGNRCYKCAAEWGFEKS